jgi:hypothetical protein
MLIEHLIPVAKLLHEEPDLILRDVVLAIEHVLIQIAPIAKLHNDVEIPLAGDLDLLVVDQVGMDWQLLQDLQFGLVDAAGFLLGEGDDLADQLLLEVVQVVSLDYSG